jgi:hypothetical protein
VLRVLMRPDRVIADLTVDRIAEDVALPDLPAIEAPPLRPSAPLGVGAQAPLTAGAAVLICGQVGAAFRTGPGVDRGVDRRSTAPPLGMGVAGDPQQPTPINHHHLSLNGGWAGSAAEDRCGGSGRAVDRVGWWHEGGLIRVGGMGWDEMKRGTVLSVMGALAHTQSSGHGVRQTLGRDRELVRFVGVHGAVAIEHVMAALGVGRTAAYRRVAVCIEGGLLERLGLLREEPSLLRATRAGLRYAGLGFGPAVVSPGSVDHWLRCATTALKLGDEFGAKRVLSARGALTTSPSARRRRGRGGSPSC